MKKLDRINELVDELNELKLGCMAASLDSLYHSKSFDELDAVSLLEQVIGPEYQNKTSQRFQNRLKRAHLAGGPQSLDKCKDSTERVYLPSDINATLSSLDFIREGLNVCILGPSDSGKSYLAKALGIQVFFASTFSSKMQIDFLKVAWGISPLLHFLLRHSFGCRRGVVAGIQSLLVTDM